MSGRVENLDMAKARRDAERRKGLVMDAYDRFERAEKRSVAEARAEIERAARQRL